MAGAAMGELAKFTFDTIFEEGDAAPEKREEPEQDPRELPVYSEIDIEAARAEAFEQGATLGEQKARDAAHEAMVAVLDQVARELPGLAAKLGKIGENARKEAAVLAFKIASKFAGALIEREPIVEVEAMIADALSQLGEQGNVPRIVVRVAEDLVDPLGEHVDGLAAQVGFGGQIVLLADTALSGSNCRVEWADGGAERDLAALEDEIEAAVLRYASTHGNGVPEDKPEAKDAIAAAEPEEQADTATVEAVATERTAAEEAPAAIDEASATEEVPTVEEAPAVADESTAEDEPAVEESPATEQDVAAAEEYAAEPEAEDDPARSEDADNEE